MAAAVMPKLFDSEVIAELKQQALDGAGLNQMIMHVQERLGFARDFIVPVFPYFCRAFSLPLVEVLPLREYSKNRDIPELKALLNKIRKAASEEHLSLVKAASDGKVDDLRCPRCESQTVSVYFTRPAPKEYHTWFVCSNCDFSMRAQNSGKPEFYTQERDRTGKKAVAAASDEPS